VDTLGGRFITGEDSGITLEDVDLIGCETRWIGVPLKAAVIPGLLLLTESGTAKSVCQRGVRR